VKVDHLQTPEEVGRDLLLLHLRGQYVYKAKGVIYTFHEAQNSFTFYNYPVNFMYMKQSGGRVRIESTPGKL
jgi:hypothetical protein